LAINHVEIKDFLVFKGTFNADFCPGVNVLIGGNGTGKTTLIRSMYYYFKGKKYGAYQNGKKVENLERIVRDNLNAFGSGNFPEDLYYQYSINLFLDDSVQPDVIFIPEKDILEHAKGLLTFIEDKQTGFSSIYKDVLIKAQDIPTQQQTATQKYLGKIISDTIGGKVKWDKGDGSFYTIRTNGDRIPFANEASGFKKLGFLGLLIACGQLKANTILFWDEPENSLNPELVPELVNILLRLSQNGVQVFIATHDYNLARYFDVRKDKSVPVTFHNLSKAENGQIICKSSSEYTKLPDNLLETASAALFKAVVANAMGVKDSV
jgi:AAA15 family ATPase/GTPase